MKAGPKALEVSRARRCTERVTERNGLAGSESDVVLSGALESGTKKAKPVGSSSHGKPSTKRSRIQAATQQANRADASVLRTSSPLIGALGVRIESLAGAI